MRLFRSEFRKGQWNRTLNYKSSVRRLSPMQCCLVTCMLLCIGWATFKAATSKRKSDVVAFSLNMQHEANIKLAAVAAASAAAAGAAPKSAASGSNRRLLATSTASNLTYYDKYCNPLSSKPNSTHIAWETCDFERSTNNDAGWVALYVIITIIIFVAIAIVCDDFFVPSLEIISEKLSLSEDVAGATFMAAGSSAPELFSSVAAVSFDSDAGVGTIAGSAVFNLLVIISLTAAFAGKVLHLDWRPLARDSVWYLLSIIWFIITVSDSLVQIWEAVVLLVLYLLYIVIMIFNPQLMKKLEQLENKCCCNKVKPEGEDDTEGSKASVRSQEPRQFQHDRRNSVLLNLHGSKVSLRDDKDGKEDNKNKNKGKANANGSANREVSTHSVVLQYSEVTKSNQSVSDADTKSTSGKSEEEEEESPRIKCCGCCPDIRGAPPQKEENMSGSDWALFVLKWVIFVVAFPFICLYSWTIPECSRPELKKYFLISFFVSVLWIAGLSFAMITVVARMGCLIGIDTFVMSLVVLAAGTSIPDLLSSIIVARDGFGDMAVSNAIGSNVFDIDLGLGLPFLIRLAVGGAEPLDMFSDNERREQCEGRMYVMPHLKFGAILGGLLAICMIVIIIARFRLGKIIGITFFVMYILFLVYAFVQEFACSYNC